MCRLLCSHIYPGHRGQTQQQHYGQRWWTGKGLTSFYITYMHLFCFFLKWAPCSSGEEIQTQNFCMYNINDIIMQTQMYSFFPLLNKQAVLRGKQCPRTLFEAWKVAGSATYNQSKTVWNCVVVLFIQSWKQRHFVYFVRLGIKQINISYPNLPWIDD